MSPHEGSEAECSYISILTLTSAPEKSGWSTPHPARFTLEERDPVLIVQETVWASRASVEGYGKSHPHRLSVPDRLGRSEPLISAHVGKYIWEL
jgi:hypothetical protein